VLSNQENNTLLDWLDPASPVAPARQHISWIMSLLFVKAPLTFYAHLPVPSKKKVRLG
jgi:hypothetical protein